MKKRGTGWIPDYPDIRDYTLDTEAIQNLGNKIQSQGDTISIENLAEKVYQALDILIQDTKIKDAKNKQITDIMTDLEKEILGDVRFVTVENHNIFKKGMADSQVLLIKSYLQRIIETWKLSSADKQKINDPTNMMFDQEIENIVREVIKYQKHLNLNNHILVGYEEMEALKFLANLAYTTTIDTNLNSCRDLTKKWMTFINNIKPDEIEQFDRFFQVSDQNNRFEKVFQFTLADALFPIYDKLGELCITMNNYICNNIVKDNYQKHPNRNDFYKKIQKLKTHLSESSKEIEKDEINKAIIILQQVLGKDKKCDSFYALNKVLRDISVNKKDLLEILFDKILDDNDWQKQKESIEFLSEKLEIIYTRYKFFEQLIKEIYTVTVPPLVPLQFLKRVEVSIQSPISNPVFELCGKKLLNLESLESDNSQSQPEERSVQKFIKSSKGKPLKQLVQSTIEVLAQMLMPLAQYSNLSEAVERGIKEIHYLLEKESKKKTKKLIKEAIEEYNLSQIKSFSLVEDLNFSELISAVLQQFITDTNKEQINIDPRQEKSQEESSLIEDPVLSESLKKILEKFLKFQNNERSAQSNHFQQEKKETQKLDVQKFIDTPEKEKNRQHNQSQQEKHKKPLFEISINELKRLKLITPEKASDDAKTEKPASETTEKSSQQRKNSLQFPINSLLHELIKKELTSKNKQEKTQEEKVFLSLPEFVDLSYWCSPIEDQGFLNSCTSHAAIALMEYAQKKSFGTYIDGSSRFLYKVTRNLMQREEDSGASVRDTMKAMVAFGVCPEQYWDYDEDKFDEEPTPFCYSFAENYKTLKYFRLDYASISRYTLLAQVKVLLASEIPCIFGFTLYDSVYDEVNVKRGHVPLPNKYDKVVGGHTVVAVGYHDRKVIKNGDADPSEGALLIRNSWGTRWGQGGYGWLPYDYIIQGLTADWWSLLKAEWLATGRFGAGASAWNTDKGGEGDPKPGQG